MHALKTSSSPRSQFAWLVFLFALAMTGIVIYVAAPEPQRPATAHFLAAQLGALIGYCLVATVIAGLAKLALKRPWKWFHWLNTITFVGAIIFMYRLCFATPDTEPMRATSSPVSQAASIVGVWHCTATASGTLRVITYRADGTMMITKSDGSSASGWSATNWAISDGTIVSSSADKETFTKSRIVRLDTSRFITVGTNGNEISCVR
jgi:hypothetical protein